MNGEELLDCYNAINSYEPKISECFDIQGIIIETVNSNKLLNCEKCFFNHTAYCPSVKCFAKERKDKNDVYFKFKNK